jgi:hypothetical protein
MIRYKILPAECGVRGHVKQDNLLLPISYCWVAFVVFMPRTSCANTAFSWYTCLPALYLALSGKQTFNKVLIQRQCMIILMGQVAQRFSVLLSAIILLVIVTPPLKAFADGISERTFTASFDGREAKLLVKVNPPILTSENKQDAFMLFRLYDSNTNQTIKFTTLFLTITKGDKTLISDFFQSAEGLLKLKIQPDETASKVTVYGNREGFLLALVADPQGTINVKGPILIEGGLYRIHVEVFGIDNPKKIFPADNMSRFDAYLSVGDIAHRQVDYGGQSNNVTIVSYYDKVNDDTKFDGKALSWSMPFNYNVSRINKEADIFVHEEVRMPRSFEGLGDSILYLGTVNGNLVQPWSLVVDPYTSETEMIVHFLISKKDIVKLAEEYQKHNSNQLGVMNFTLSEGRNAQVETSTRLITDTGGMFVNLQYEPGQLKGGADANLNLQFIDQISDLPLGKDMRYNLTMFDMEGNQVLNKTGLVARNATGTVPIKLPQDGNYQMVVSVKQVVTDSPSGPVSDSTRSGRAIGYVVVPEFGMLAAVVMAASMAGIIGYARYRKI